MSHCNHSYHNDFFDFSSLGEIGILLTIVVTGIIGSLTHCIGMCGPFAAAQTSMRLMGIQNKKISEFERLKVAFLLPYYIGKALTYSLITLLFFIFKNSVSRMSDLPYINLAAFVFLSLISLLFIITAFRKNLSIPLIGFDALGKRLSKAISPWRLSTYGVQGFMMGMILGLIPCGLVYGMIINAITNISSMWLAVATMFLFGLSTIPGLFVASFFGVQILNRFKQSFKYIYSLMMLLNAALLLQFALKLI